MADEQVLIGRKAEITDCLEHQGAHEGMSGEIAEVLADETYLVRLPSGATCLAGSVRLYRERTTQIPSSDAPKKRRGRPPRNVEPRAQDAEQLETVIAKVAPTKSSKLPVFSMDMPDDGWLNLRYDAEGCVVEAVNLDKKHLIKILRYIKGIIAINPLEMQ